MGHGQIAVSRRSSDVRFRGRDRFSLGLVRGNSQRVLVGWIVPQSSGRRPGVDENLVWADLRGRLLDDLDLRMRRIGDGEQHDDSHETDQACQLVFLLTVMVVTERQQSRGGRREINFWIPPRSATRVHRLVRAGYDRRYRQ